MTREEREQASIALDELAFWAKGNAVTLQDKHFKALRIAMDVLYGPQPDPETGLVPCGCGGNPTFEHFNDGFFELDRVECKHCNLMLTAPTNTGKWAWNTAMGYKHEI